MKSIIEHAATLENNSYIEVKATHKHKACNNWGETVMEVETKIKSMHNVALITSDSFRVLNK